MTIQTLKTTALFELQKSSRFLWAKWKVKTISLSSTPIHGGIQEHLTHFANHQCGEGKAHAQRYNTLIKDGPSAYQHFACQEAGLPAENTAIMSTAANMDVAATETMAWEDLEITAVVTAGVQGNATRAGDSARYHEKDGQWLPATPLPGTINILLLINVPMQAGGLTQALITATEAKSSALQDLFVGSLASPTQATGTGTDQMIIACPQEGSSRQSAGTHTRMGELIGKTVHRATMKALEWQNGLSPSLSRNLSHLFKRLGFDQNEWQQALETQTTCPSELLLANIQAILHDPQICAVAASLCTILDRVRVGALPENLLNHQCRRHATLMAVALSDRDQDYHSLFEQLPQTSSIVQLLAHAVALGWREKWADRTKVD